jgi:hypothetical protein
VDRLAQTAQQNGLGRLISEHRLERPLIRFRAGYGWLLFGGLLMGVPIAVALDREAIGVVVVLVAAHLILAAGAGPVAARLFAPDGPAQSVALFDHGLIKTTGEDLRVVRFDQVRQVVQDRGHSTSDGRQFSAKSAAARVFIVDDGGREVVLDFHGYRHQDRFIDELRARVAGGPSRSAKTALKRGSVSHGGLVMTEQGLTTAAGEGLADGQAPTLPWAEVGQVNERDNGTVSVYRRSPTGGQSLWFSAVIPDASAAAAMIVHQRNRAQD